MTCDFQHGKIVRVFTALDVDGDGYLTEDDFRALTARWTALRGDGDHAPLATVMTGWWATLRDAAGAGRVALADVLAVVDQLGRMPQAVAGTAEAMFEAVDENADGRVSPAEYHQMTEFWAGDNPDAPAPTSSAPFRPAPVIIK